MTNRKTKPSSRRVRAHLAREGKTIAAMVRIYCRKNHRASPGLCPECDGLRRYALERLDSCPFIERKPACDRCPVHCYMPVRREKIKAVMRFAGPRMLTRHPWLAVRHLLDRRVVPSAPPGKKR